MVSVVIYNWIIETKTFLAQYADWRPRGQGVREIETGKWSPSITNIEQIWTHISVLYVKCYWDVFICEHNILMLWPSWLTYHNICLDRTGQHTNTINMYSWVDWETFNRLKLWKFSKYIICSLCVFWMALEHRLNPSFSFSVCGGWVDEPN